jgi:hypothetical protein
MSSFTQKPVENLRNFPTRSSPEKKAINVEVKKLNEQQWKALKYVEGTVNKE